MKYPEYYVHDVHDDVHDVEKENGIEEEDDDMGFEHSEHLRFSTNSYRQSLDENSAALREYNQRYSNGSNRSKSSRRGTRKDVSNRYSRESRDASTSSRRHSKNEERHSSHHQRSSTSSSTDCEKTIALFGVSGVTGHYFLQLAVEAGYQVRALILPGFELEEMKENPNLTLINGTMDDETNIYRVIRKAAYVVCMLNDCPQTLEPSPGTNPPPSNYEFIRKLVPLMSKCSSCKVLLYQVSITLSSSSCFWCILFQMLTRYQPYNFTQFIRQRRQQVTRRVRPPCLQVSKRS